MERPLSPSLQLEESAPKAQKVVHYTTNNYITNNIHNYFHIQPGPSPPPEANYKGKIKKLRNGTLKKKCNKGRHCPHGLQNIINFTPTSCNKNDAKRLPKFNKAMEVYESALKRNDEPATNAAITDIDKWSSNRCKHCRKILHKSQFEGENSKLAKVRRGIAKLRTERFKTCDECGTDRAIEFDHRRGTKPKGMKSACSPSLLLKYFKTPEACIQHLEESCDPRCRCCHKLQPTSDTAKKYKEIDQNKSSRTNKKYVQMKQKYNDGLKHQVGKCENPDCPKDGPSNGVVVFGKEQCFEWNHLDQTKKSRKEDGTPLGVGELCQLTTRDPDWKTKVDYERSLCNLLCSNCHHEHTNRDRSSENA